MSASRQPTGREEIGFNVGVVNGKVGFSFTHDWSWGGSESQTVGLGSSDNISVVLGPGQKVDAQPESSRGDLTVDVDYLATVGGDALGTSGDQTHSWFASRVLGDKNLQRITQTVTVGYYSNDSILLVDPTTNEVTALPRATSLPANLPAPAS